MSGIEQAVEVTATPVHDKDELGIEAA